MSISVCMPTRGRPSSMLEIVESIDKTAMGAVEVVFYVDKDDEPSANMARDLSSRHDVVLVKGPRIKMSDTYNRCAERATGEILMECCDQVLFHSAGWDLMVEEAFDAVDDRILLVFGEDDIHHGRAATLPFLHRRWVDTVGYFMPPYFTCDYCDTWVWEMSQILKRSVYLPEMHIQHRHPEAGTAPLDQTKREGYERGARDGNAELFRSKRPERVADAEKLRAVMAR